MSRAFFATESPGPTCVGTGLVALDVLINGKQSHNPRLWAGGSCANVLTILACLGWSAYPIARLGADQASDVILEDTQRWGVRSDLMFRDIRSSTPIVIEKLAKGRNALTHEFRFTCPNCGAPLPRNRPISAELVDKIIPRMPFAQVYYFDRVSRAALDFAKVQRSSGALIVFEPCKFNTDGLFKSCLDIAHIVKYSSEIMHGKTLRRKTPLEIQTLGSEGLRYRMASATRECGWQKLEAFRVRELVDSAGAGDWCSAGVIHLLGRNGAEGFHEVSREEVENALGFGQRLAALDCLYEGARGLMYSLGKVELVSLVQKLVLEKSFEQHSPKVLQENRRGASVFTCPSCPHQ